VCWMNPPPPPNGNIDLASTFTSNKPLQHIQRDLASGDSYRSVYISRGCLIRRSTKM
jgi:hypothetical protein